ncbi:MAG: hypothetical protein WC136_00855 [Sphaerochaeta sp.]|jgi:hypothetical protein
MINYTTVDPRILDNYNEPSLTGNLIIDNESYIRNPDNLITVFVEDNLKYRPDVISLKYYGNDSYFPLVLAANNIGTLMDFIPSNFNNQIKIIHPKLIDVLKMQR